MIHLGDLVRVRYTYPVGLMEVISNKDAEVGLVIHVDHAFYGPHANRMNRLHVLWWNGDITLEPESYVEFVSNGE